MSSGVLPVHDGNSRSLANPPRTIIVELTNVCDLQCPLCTTAMGMRRSPGFMTFEVFQGLIADLADCQEKPLISMNMAGEPLLHRQVADFVAHATQCAHRTFISTNATRLTKSLAERLVQAGLSAIHLCVDGASAESHEAYRVGSSFQQVREHCQGLLEARRRLGSATPFVTIQTLLTAHAENELHQVLDWAWRIGADEVFFKSLSLGSGTTDEQKHAASHLVPLRAEFRRGSTATVTACNYPAEHVLVYWNGDLGVCCVDFNNMANLPGLRQFGGLRAALDSQLVLEARGRGLRAEHSLCARCQSVGAGFRGFRVPLHALRQEFSGGPPPSWEDVLGHYQVESR